MSTGPGHHLHQAYRGLEETLQTPGRVLHIQARAQLGLLRGDPCGAVVTVAHASTDTTDGLHGAVGECHTIGSQRQRLDEIRVRAQASGDQQGDPPAGSLAIEITARSRQCWNGGYADVVAEHQGGRTGPPAPAVENDVIGPGIQSELYVPFDMVGAQLETHRDTARKLADMVGEAGEIADGGKVRERRR